MKKHTHKIAIDKDGSRRMNDEGWYECECGAKTFPNCDWFNPSPTTMKECNHEYEDGSVMAVGTCKMCGKYVDVLVDGQPSEKNCPLYQYESRNGHAHDCPNKLSEEKECICTNEMGTMLRGDCPLYEEHMKIDVEPSEEKEGGMKSALYLHAKKELELLGMYDDNEENKDGLQPELADNILEMIEVWGKVGHSGGSAMWTRQILHKLLNYEALTPITSNPKEWNDVSEMNGSPMWQSNRNPALFSTDGGKTYYHVDDKKRKIIKAK